MDCPKIDLHGMTVDEALTQFHVFIGHYLINDNADFLEIITGDGPIRRKVEEELDSLELNYTINAYNLGRILVHMRD